MTTVTQLIAYLKTLPPETEVRVLRRYSRHYDTMTEWVDLDIDPYSNNADVIGNTLRLGDD